MDQTLFKTPRPTAAGQAMSTDTLRILLEYLEPACPSFVASLHADGGAVDLRAVLRRYATLVGLIQAAADFCHCDHLGLMLGQAWSLPDLRREHSAPANGPELFLHLAAARKKLHLHDLGQIAGLASQETVRLSYVVTDPAIETGSVLADLEVLLMQRVLSRLLGPGWTPELIELPRREPRDYRPYRRAFNCPISFNASVAALHYDARRFNHAVPSAYHRSAGMGGYSSDKAVAAAISERVVEQLTLSISMGESASAEHIAHLLGMCSRTLQRQLDQTQTSYRVLSDGVRFGMARRLLRDTDIEVTEIALALGYSDVSVLTRAFARWAGTCPSSWRAELQSADARTRGNTPTRESGPKAGPGKPILRTSAAV